MIVERVKTGLARAKAQGKKLGPPTKNLDPKVERRIIDMRAEGRGMNAIGRELGLGMKTVERVLSK